MMIGRREGDDSQPDSRYPAHLGDHVVPESVRQERSMGGSAVTELERPTVAVDGGMLTALRFRWVGTGCAVHRMLGAGGAFMQFLGPFCPADLGELSDVTTWSPGSAATTASPPFLCPARSLPGLVGTCDQSQQHLAEG